MSTIPYSDDTDLSVAQIVGSFVKNVFVGFQLLQGWDDKVAHIFDPMPYTGKGFHKYFISAGVLGKALTLDVTQHGIAHERRHSRRIIWANP